LQLENDNFNYMHKTIAISPNTENQLLASLVTAESIRKKILLNYSIIGFVLFAGLIIEAVTWMSIAVVIIILFVLVYTKWYGIPVIKFETSFLHQVTKNALSIVDDKLKVDYGSHLKLSELNATPLFAATPDYFSGKNLIFGDVNGHSLRLSEIYATWHQKDDKQFPAVKGVFNGFVMIANTINNAENTIIVTTDLKRVEAAIALDKNLKTGIITPGVIYYCATQLPLIPKQINLLAEQFKQYYIENEKHIVATIHPKSTCIAIMNNAIHHYLKPSVFRTVYDKQAIARYYQDLNFLRKCFDSCVILE